MANSWRRVGLIVNPAAGVGAGESLTAARAAIHCLGVHEVWTGLGQTGADALSDWSGRVQVCDVESASGRNRTRNLVRWAADQKVDALIVVGGDGTLADVAQVFIEVGCRAPIVGLGTGSTNVGRLITCRATRAAELDPAELETWSADCLLACVDDKLLGVALNDVVIGHTIVGTIDGRLRDLSAAERMLGKIVPGKPRPVGNPRTRVTRVGAGKGTLIAEGASVGTVVAGFAESSFFGKAITGGICLAAITGLPAGCLVCDVPLAHVETSGERLMSAAPMISKYVSLAEGTNIVVENMGENAALCVDGNPLHLLRESERVVISVRLAAVTGVRSRKDLRST